MSYDDDDLPVLNDVVRTGDESIIQSTRLEHEVEGEIESLQNATIEFDLPSHLQLGVQSAVASDNIELEIADVPATEMAASLEEIEDALIADPDVQQSIDDELELLIDDIVDRHVTSLRRDLRALLERASRLRP